MKLGVFTVACKEWDPIEAMDRVAAMGYDGVELRVRDDKKDPINLSAEDVIERADELKAKAKETGLEIPSIASYVQSTDMDASVRHLKACAAVGAKCVRIGSGNYQADGPPCWEQLQAAKKNYAEVAKQAAQLGVRAVIETHMGRLAPTVLGARMILDGLDPAHVGIMWDPANQVREGHDRYDMAVDLAGHYMAEVHVKNTRFRAQDETGGRQPWKPEWAPLRKGIVDWPKVISLLKDSGYDGWLITEDFSNEEPLEQKLQSGHDWLRELSG